MTAQPHPVAVGAGWAIGATRFRFNGTVKFDLLITQRMILIHRFERLPQRRDDGAHGSLERAFLIDKNPER